MLALVIAAIAEAIESRLLHALPAAANGAAAVWMAESLGAALGYGAFAAAIGVGEVAIAITAGYLKCLYLRLDGSLVMIK